MFALAIFALGCGDDASIGVISEVSSDATDTTGNAISWGDDGNVGFPDVSYPEGDGEGVETDAEDPEDDGENTEADTEETEDVLEPEEDGEDLDAEGGEETTDTEGEGGESEGGGENSEEGGEPVVAQVGESCAPDAICVEGATCIEIEDGSVETQCYEDVLAGLPCGPGYGQCVVGSNCVSDPNGDGKICAEVVESGSDCESPGVTCPSGELCLASSDVTGFDWAGTWELPADVSASGMFWEEATETLWVSDAAGGQVLGFDADGTLVTTVTSAPLVEGEEGSVLVSPAGLFISGGTLWIADPGSQSIWKGEAPDYAIEVVASGAGLFGSDGPAALTFVEELSGVVIFATVPSLNAVVQLSETGNFQGMIGGDVLVAPQGIWNWGGGLWVADSGNSRITVLDYDGLVLLEYGGPEAENGGLVAPDGIALSESGDFIYVSDSSAQKLVVMDFDGVPLTELDFEDDSMPMGVAPNAAGTVFFSADATLGTVNQYGAVYAKVCTQPAGAGEPCEGEQGIPCASGLVCVEEAPGLSDKICKGEIAEGGDCSVPNAVCITGTECVRGNAAAAHERVCLIQVELGEPCGPGVAGCVDGAGCNWEGPLHGLRVCFPDAGLSEVCNGYAAGDCVLGTSCVHELPGSTVKICRANLAEGADCGPLAGATCHPWLSCNYGTSVLDRTCFPFQTEGEVCGIGSGACEEGTTCQFETDTALTPVCITDSPVGEECAALGKGLCDFEAADCILSSPLGPAICLEKSTPDGEACGIYGAPPCMNGTECLVDFVGAATASCYEDHATQGTPCGVQFGVCDEAEGQACAIDDPDNLTGNCTPNPPEYGACGSLEEGAPGCGLLTSTCTCSSPFVAMDVYDPLLCQAAGFSEVCVPNLNVYDYCAVNTGLIGTEAEQGWIGLCPVDTVCTGSLGYSFGAPIASELDALTTIVFQCKPTVGLNQACGQTVACDGGLDCLCGANQVCTILEGMAGDQGVCGPPVTQP